MDSRATGRSSIYGLLAVGQPNLDSSVIDDDHAGVSELLVGHFEVGERLRVRREHVQDHSIYGLDVGETYGGRGFGERGGGEIYGIYDGRGFGIVILVSCP